MAAQPDTGPAHASDNDMPAHERGYGAFLRMLKWGTIASVLVTAFVVYILVA